MVRLISIGSMLMPAIDLKFLQTVIRTDLTQRTFSVFCTEFVITGTVHYTVYNIPNIRFAMLTMV